MARPFVAERLEAAGALFERDPGALLPPIREILAGARRYDGAAVFAAQNRRRALARRAHEALAQIDCLVVPTAPTIYGVAAVQADPIRLNATLGRYVNFVNLVGLAAVAAPARLSRRRAALRRHVHRPVGARTGGSPASPIASSARRASGWAPRPRCAPTSRPSFQRRRPGRGSPSWARTCRESRSGHQLTSVGGVLVRSCRTSPRYRFYALPNTIPAKPGLVRAAEGATGAASIEVEVWALPAAAFGQFVARVPAPLCIGSVELEDGARVSGFLCEPLAILGARDISSFGGWRAFRQTTA